MSGGFYLSFRLAWKLAAVLWLLGAYSAWWVDLTATPPASPRHAIAVPAAAAEGCNI